MSALLLKKKELEEKRLLEEAIVELKNTNIENEEEQNDNQTMRVCVCVCVSRACVCVCVCVQMFRAKIKTTCVKWTKTRVNSFGELWKIELVLSPAILSEQLRLILEPTLESTAAKHRTGKRLNNVKSITLPRFS